MITSSHSSVTILILRAPMPEHNIAVSKVKNDEEMAVFMSHPKRIEHVLRAGTLAVAAMAGMLLFAAPPANAQGWNIDQGVTPSEGSEVGWFMLTYAANLKGASFGAGSCGNVSYQADLGYVAFYCTGQGGSTLGLNQTVRNNAHSLASLKCHGATTWVYPNSVGNYNWVHARRWGTLNSALANNEASAGRGNLC